MKEMVKKGTGFGMTCTRLLDNIENGYRLCIWRDLNRWIGDNTRANITMLLEFQERMIIAEEWWTFVQKRDCV